MRDRSLPLLWKQSRRHILAFPAKSIWRIILRRFPYAAISGRVVVDMLTQAELGIAFNWGVLASEMVVTAEDRG